MTVPDVPLVVCHVKAWAEQYRWYGPTQNAPYQCPCRGELQTQFCWTRHNVEKFVTVMTKFKVVANKRGLAALQRHRSHIPFSLWLPQTNVRLVALEYGLRRIVSERAYAPLKEALRPS